MPSNYGCEVIILKPLARALLVEDDNDICELVRIILRSESIELDIANDGKCGLHKALDSHYDIVILDLMLPELSGWDVCRKLRQNPGTRSIPIMMLTAKGEEKDKVYGLEQGADDYVAKPFSPREFLARVKALLRRSADYNRSPETMKFEKLFIDAQGYEATVNGKPLSLTPKEFDLLFLLANNAGAVLEREALLEQVWGYNYLGDTRTIDEHIKRIRQKLAEEDPENTYIQTVWGVGYKFEVKADVE